MLILDKRVIEFVRDLFVIWLLWLLHIRNMDIKGHVAVNSFTVVISYEDKEF